ncbi:hypothetical protein [Arenimonas sp. SCN 70-307]|uniref:hypothetical protein n=1 Tax=Arenimonas sp. SCN 70-307 TaxID=1660089 RepID=UPI0025C05035|nr:hypothetical protein [Arenimonas sp. SCN 70-307]
MRLFCAVLLSLSMVSATFAAEPKVGPKLRLNLQVLVPVDAEGQAGTPRIGEELPEEAQALVIERVGALRYEPATRDGAPVPSELSLSVPFTAQNIDGTVHYTVGEATAAPIIKQIPNYPVEAIRDGAAAALVVRVEVAAEPGPDRVKAEVVASEFASRRASRYKRQFEQAAIQSLSACCRLVETIDGQPLGRVEYVAISYSTTFNRERVDAEALKASHAGEVVDLPAGLRRAKVVESPDAPKAPAG